MKKLITILMTILLVSSLVPLAMAKDVTVRFTWDPYTQTTETKPEEIADILIYQRTAEGTYDYNNPIATVTQSVVDGASSPTETTPIPLIYPDGQNTTYSFVARARDVSGLVSEDSNEVTLGYNLTPLTAIADLVAVFNKVAMTIDFTWSQTDAERITSWKLYKSNIAGGPYTEVASIQWDGSSSSVSSSIPADTLTPGSITYFVVVAFDDVNGLFTPNSNEVMIERKPPTKVINLKITLQ